MLSPLPHIDVYRGQAYLIDVMNSRCVTADLSESISNGHTVISHSVVFDHKGSSHLVFPSFYALGDASLLAFDTGLTGAERNGEYSYAPRYSMYVLHSGEKIKDYEFSVYNILTLIIKMNGRIITGIAVETCVYTVNQKSRTRQRCFNGNSGGSDDTRGAADGYAECIGTADP